MDSSPLEGASRVETVNLFDLRRSATVLNLETIHRLEAARAA